MEVTGEGLRMWYGTPDAPVGRGGVTVGVAPCHPANAVIVEMRRAGTVTRWPARAVRGDVVPIAAGPGAVQYFRADFRALKEGEEAQIRPILSCAGRRIPVPSEADPADARGGWMSYRHRREEPASQAPSAPSPEVGTAPAFGVGLKWMGTVTARLRKPPEKIGEVPRGLRLNFAIVEGECRGPGLRARILPEGGDWMLIQRDGVAIPDVRTTWETEDGALLYGEYTGVFDLGPEGYERALRGSFPSFPAVQLAPRFTTHHPRYRWLNRLQCLGIGEVDMTALIVRYDLYAVGTQRTQGAGAGREGVP